MLSKLQPGTRIFLCFSFMLMCFLAVAWIGWFGLQSVQIRQAILDETTRQMFHLQQANGERLRAQIAVEQWFSTQEDNLLRVAEESLKKSSELSKQASDRIMDFMEARRLSERLIILDHEYDNIVREAAQVVNERSKIVQQIHVARKSVQVIVDQWEQTIRKSFDEQEPFEESRKNFFAFQDLKRQVAGLLNDEDGPDPPKELNDKYTRTHVTLDDIFTKITDPESQKTSTELQPELQQEFKSRIKELFELEKKREDRTQTLSQILKDKNTLAEKFEQISLELEKAFEQWFKEFDGDLFKMHQILRTMIMIATTVSIVFVVGLGVILANSFKKPAFERPEFTNGFASRYPTPTTGETGASPDTALLGQIADKLQQILELLRRS